MKKIQDSAAYAFIICVAVLSVVSILGVWKIFSDDVITKSFQTIGLLGAVAVIVMVAGRFIDERKSGEISADPSMVSQIAPQLNIGTLFTAIRHSTLAVLITSVVFLAFFGVLAIWEVLSKEVTNKSLSSIGILAFASFVIVLTCMDRENHPLLHQKGKSLSGGMIVLIIVIAFWLFRLIF
jgi:hypothetical protein